MVPDIETNSVPVVVVLVEVLVEEELVVEVLVEDDPVPEVEVNELVDVELVVTIGAAVVAVGSTSESQPAIINPAANNTAKAAPKTIPFLIFFPLV